MREASGTAPDAIAFCTSIDAGATPADVAHSTSARDEQRLERLLARARQAHAVAQHAGQPRGRVGRPGRPHGRAPRTLERHAPQCAQEEPQRGALLRGDERDVDTVALARAGAEAVEVDPRRHDVVLAGEEARDQAARHLERGEPRVEAAEEQLDEAPRDLRGQHALRGRVEAARRSARANGAAPRQKRSARTARARARCRAGARSSSVSIARLASSGSDTRPPRRAGVAIVCIGASTRTSPGANSESGRAAAARIRRRDSRTWAREPLAAITSTL